MRTLAIWGSNGSGKSTVALAFACEFTKKKKNVVVISADRTTPMFSMFLPYTKFNKDISLGEFLTEEISEETMMTKIHYHPKNKYLAFMCMGEGDSYQRYRSNWPPSKLNAMFDVLSNMTDIVIFDLTSNFMVDNFSMWALEKADSVVTVLNPDNKSTSFMNSYKILLDNDRRFKTSKHLEILNNCYEYSPYEKYMVENDIRYWLPHSYEIYNNYNCGLAHIFKGQEKEIHLFEKTIAKIIKKELIGNNESEK